METAFASTRSSPSPGRRRQQLGAAIAGAAGHPMSSHLYPEGSAHLLRATETADWLEWRDWGNPLIAEPFEVVDGQAIVPDRPGNGIEWNEAMVAKYAY